MRKSRDGQRKSRTWSEVSGVTLSTLPSGVTINDSGLFCGEGGVSITSSGIDFGVGDTAGSNLLMSFGSVAWAGASVSVNSVTHGLSSLTSFNAMYTDSDSPSAPFCRFKFGPSGVSIEAITQTILGGTTTVNGGYGGTIYWQAFGS